MTSQQWCDGGRMAAHPQFLAPQHSQVNRFRKNRNQNERRNGSYWIGVDAKRRPSQPICSTESGRPYPFDSSEPLSSRFPREEGLPLSLFTPFEELPPDGKTQTIKEIECDPLVQNCQTPTYVYEDACSLCKGTGQMESKFRGRTRVYTCTLCQGLGYVRRTTTRFIPEVNGTGPKMTLNRPREEKDLTHHLRNGHLWNGFKKHL